MPVILLASAAGSPGVTTTALGMALLWSGDTLLVEADRQPAQPLLAGYLHGTSALGRGLGGLARAHRELRPLAPELLVHCLPLTPADQQNRRILLPGFSHPGAPALFGPVWSELADALAGLSRTGTAVLIDGGRVGEGLPAPLVAIADVVLLVTRCTLRQLAGVRLHLPALRQRMEQQNAATELGLVLIGAGDPYGATEISDQFGVSAWACLPNDPASAAVWSEGEPETRRFRNAPLVKGIRATISQLSVRTQSTGIRP